MTITNHEFLNWSGDKPIQCILFTCDCGVCSQQIKFWISFWTTYSFSQLTWKGMNQWLTNIFSKRSLRASSSSVSINSTCSSNSLKSESEWGRDSCPMARVEPAFFRPHKVSSCSNTFIFCLYLRILEY